MLYVLLGSGLILSVPVETYAAGDRVLVIVGVLGLFRYTWLAINVVRALWFSTFAFPSMRKQANRQFSRKPQNGRAFFLVTTYGTDPSVTIKVYHAIFAACAASPLAPRVVASLVHMSDQRLIRSIHEQSVDKTVPLEFVRIPGTGKRDALACGLAVIATHGLQPDDVLFLVDGDSCVPTNLVSAVAPMFSLDPSVGALTTDEICEPIGTKTFRDWYRLRFNQRHLMMCSLGLGGRVLTLTGRMSAFRGDIATSPAFIDAVRDDKIEHWRLGTIKFVTGDDKSTWFWLLERGYRMLYLPDVKVVSIERQPFDSFVTSATVLMVRWFGNTFRNNGRALRLPARRIGLFTWLSILDQRVSMWTTLSGPVSAALGAIFFDPLIIVIYCGWVMISRYVYCLALQSFRPGSGTINPLLLYFSQILGALVKSWIFFRPDQQRWTRQKTETRMISQPGGALIGAISRISSSLMHLLAVSIFIVIMSVTMGLLHGF